MDVAPLVSVCIQTYQHAAFIRPCIESALAQVCDFPFEIIIGEDDSTDGTREICKEYADRNPGTIRLFLRSEKDKLYINGQQTGRFNFIENLKAARGKYIALLDGDDFWCDNSKLQKQVHFMETHPECSVSFHNGYRCDHSGRTWIKKEDHITDTLSIFDASWLYQLKGNPFLTSTCVFRSATLSVIPSWFYEVPFLDYALHMHNAGKGKIGFLPERMSVYRIHSGGMWSAPAAPANHMRLWHFYSILAKALHGEAAASVLDKRHRTGEQLVRFYRTHAGYDTGWMEQALAVNTYPNDDRLHAQLTRPLTATEKLLRVMHAGKEWVKRKKRKGLKTKG